MEKKYGYEDYLNLSDDQRYEIVEGDLQMVPSPTPYHQEISREIELALASYVKDRKLGKVFDAPCDIVLEGNTILQPDIFFIAASRCSIIQEKNIQGAPDLVIEILSQHSAYQDIVRKKRIYAKSGVKEYWLVDPMAKTVEIMVLKGSKFELYKEFSHEDTMTSYLLPDFSMLLTEIFLQ